MLFKLSESFLFLVSGTASPTECCLSSSKCNRKVSPPPLNGLSNHAATLFERSFILFRFDMFVYLCFLYLLLHKFFFHIFRFDPKVLDVLLSEVVLLNTRTELFLRFFRRRAVVSHNTVEMID